jgi:bacterioferritin
VKGQEKIIAALNGLLSMELGAINQYVVHSEMCGNWGYERLHSAVERRAVEEMKHAEKLIARLLFLEGTPIVRVLEEIHIGADVERQLHNDWTVEEGAVRAYNEGIGLCVELGDSGTRGLLEEILEEEEAHIDWLEAQRDQIDQMGIQIYLGGQRAS